MEKQINVAFLSTYPPRECGIATFTHDLAAEIKKVQGINIGVIAINDSPLHYGADVLFAIEQQNRESYSQAAARLNTSNMDVLVVQHEYGIFGGDCGEYLLDMIEQVELPVVATLHTVLSSPKKRQKQVLQALCQKSAKVVTMSNNSKEILKKVYGVNPSKIEVIHHGVPRLDLPSREELKKEMGLEGRTVVSTFGLISPGKGLEYGIEAIEKVARKHGEILYLILGQTHPVVKRQHGEDYRQKLEKMVQERKLEYNVKFVNRYLTQEEIIRYLKLSDIYMTPYLGKEQAVSGTLAYAAGYGRVIVSTPYAYAEEMLAEGRGLLADFKDAKSLAKHICFIIEHPEVKKEMEEKTQIIGRRMMWDEVARRYIEVISQVYYQDHYEFDKISREVSV